VPTGRYQCCGTYFAVLADLAFDTDFLNVLMQASLAGVALALIVGVWTDQADQEESLAITLARGIAIGSHGHDLVGRH
jgi:hypothetical protein